MIDDPRLDRWARRYHRTRSWLLCHVGVHLWARRTNPGTSGAAAVWHQCRRCGSERTAYDPPVRTHRGPVVPERPPRGWGG